MSEAHVPRGRGIRVAAVAVAVAGLGLAMAPPRTARAQTLAADEPSASPSADTHVGAGGQARFQLFTEPAPTLRLVVLQPAAAVDVAVGLPSARAVRVAVDWNADIVSGATRRVYGSPDAISGATQFADVRNNLGLQVTVEPTRQVRLFAQYRFGIENDYRTHSVGLGAAVDLFARATTLALRYSHGFDRVCTFDNRNLSSLLRVPMLDSDGCFGGVTGRIAAELAIDHVEASYTQAWTPRLVSVVAVTFQSLGGFQSNPYRAVRVLGAVGDPLETHPSRRNRGALVLRLRYAIAQTNGALGAEVRLYRDSWALQSATVEASWDQLHLARRLHWRVRVRYYQQAAAFFYRDASAADSYERNGAADGYFTGDREMSPYAAVLAGAQLVYHHTQTLGRREITLDPYVRLDLQFYLPMTALPPTLERSQQAVDAILAGAGIAGQF